MERKVKTEFERAYSEVEKEVLQALQKVMSAEKAIREIEHQYNDMREYASNLQTFIGIKEIENTLQSVSSELRNMSADKKFYHTSIQFIRHHTKDEASSQLTSLGKVEQIKSNQVVSIDINDKNTGQYEKKEMELLNENQDITLDKGDYFGCCRLSRVVLSFSLTCPLLRTI